MKALSIHQPWAWLIIHGGKDIENRRWNCNYKGDLYIHASKKADGKEYSEAVEFAKKIDPDLQIPNMSELRYGGIIGKVRMKGATRESDSKWFVGPFGFVLSKPKKVDFFEIRGMQGLFNVHIEEKRRALSRRQVMAATARRMKGVKVSFRMDPDDRESRVTGRVVEAKIGKVHEPSQLLGYEVQVQGASGKIVTIDSNERFMRIIWDSKNR
jgi:hypothetical protein